MWHNESVKVELNSKLCKVLRYYKFPEIALLSQSIKISLVRMSVKTPRRLNCAWALSENNI